MSDEQKREWEALGRQLSELSPEKYVEVLEGLRAVVETRRIISSFDWEAMLWGQLHRRHDA